MPHDTHHPAAPTVNKTQVRSTLGLDFNWKGKLTLALVMAVLPFMKSIILRQVNKLTVILVSNITLLLASYGIDNADNAALLASVVSGLISLVLLAIELFMAWVGFRLSPPPKAAPVGN